MLDSFEINLSSFKLVNHLWPKLVARLGIDNAYSAVRQSLDLQAMNAGTSTLPVLISESCGIALTSLYSFQSQTGISCNGDKLVLILSIKTNSFQILNEL